MIQRVGIAQALLNDPDVVFLDEPMSGLDPLGRRDVRTLILELRDQGRTVFFSSHILTDAEALCSRVAVVAGGQLMAEGRVSDILALRVHGWELVVANASPEAIGRLGPRVRRSTEIAPRRYTLELPLEAEPERVLAELTAAGATLVSLNPLRETLEDFFVRRVAGASDGARPARAGDTPAARGGRPDAHHVSH
jgi:ABC-2 type transport system ATP-binding protein